MAKLYRRQVEGGRVFLHENPAHAKSWALPCIRKLMRDQGVCVVEADQCMFGLKTWGANKSQLVLAKKPTRFITNSQVLGRELSRRCDKKPRAPAPSRWPGEGRSPLPARVMQGRM